MTKKTAWKGIQKKQTDLNVVDSTEVLEVSDIRSTSSKNTDFADEEEEDEDDDYFQDEDPEEEQKQQDLLKMKAQAIEQDKQRYLESHTDDKELDEDVLTLDPPSEQVPDSKMSAFILPALQNHGFSDEEESLKDPNEPEAKKEAPTTTDLDAEVESLAVASVPLHVTSNPIADHEEPTIVEHQNGLENSASSATSESSPRLSNDTTSSDQSEKQPSTPPPNHLIAILPAVEESVRSVTREKLVYHDDQLLPEEYERANRSREFEHSIEDPIDLDMFRDNVIAIQAVDTKEIPVNLLKPHEQEKVDEPVREGMKLLFDNKFMKAKNIFQTKASIDPLYALGLGAMAFIKAMMTYHESDIDTAMNALATAYTVAKTQIDKSIYKKPLKETVSQYFTTLLSSNSTGLPANPPSISMPNSSGGMASPRAFIPNGVLRAHVVKAECCLLMGILQMTQESVMGYIKCGLNIRRAYHSYSIVWQEYKRMGQEYTKYMDCDTVSAIQFGIGAVHLLLSSMPPKILKIFSSLGWKSDKQLGFALLKLCLEGRGIRAPLASLTLLAYYTILTSFAPQLYSKDMMSPAIECLLDAQSHHPNSCFFLFFAARIARVAKNIPLSTQSFTFAAESSRGEWAEVAMKQMSDYEIGFNLAIQMDWIHAASYFEQLSQEKYWSPAFSKYFCGACYEMLGQRTEAILAFAQVPQLSQDMNQDKTTYIDAFVFKKVEFFQKSGYQDMDFSLPGLEILLVMNAFEHMETEHLEQCLELVQRTLEKVYEREKIEYNIRLRELVPMTNPPDYYDQRAVLLLTKASILNSLGQYKETIAHLNWILDNKERITQENWVLPFTYWESGVTSWGLGNYTKSRKLWQSAMACTKYDFEYRMAVRLSLALGKCDEVGVPHIKEKEIKSTTTTNGRKRMPVLTS